MMETQINSMTFDSSRTVVPLTWKESSQVINSREVQNLLTATFGERLICKGGPIPWPAISPIPCFFCHEDVTD